MSQRILFLMGLAPYKVNIEVYPPGGTALIFKFSHSRIGCAYNILLIIMIVGSMIAGVPLLNAIENYPGTGTFGKIIDIGLSIMGNIVILITILIYSIYQQSLVQIGNQLNEFYVKCESGFFGLYQTRNNYFHYFLIICSFSIFAIFLVASYLIMFPQLSFFAFMCCNIICETFIMQYSLMIKVLVGSMREINRAFRKLNKYSVATAGNPLFPGDLGNYRSVIQSLTELRRARTNLCRIANRVSDFHALPTLFVIFYCCCYCVDSLYFLIISVLDPWQFSFNFNLFYNVLWMVMIMGPIVFLSETVKRFGAEMEKTADLVYEIGETFVASKGITSVLNDFAVELLHRKVIFSAHGFFSLDCTLLYSIFGMVVTYLIILLQFRPSAIPTQEPDL